MPLVYRPARAQDLEHAEALVVVSINDLTERHNFGAMATARPPQTFNCSPSRMTLVAYGWRTTPVKSSALPGAGYAAICGFSPNYS